MVDGACLISSSARRLAGFRFLSLVVLLFVIVVFCFGSHDKILELLESLQSGRCSRSAVDLLYSFTLLESSLESLLGT